MSLPGLRHLRVGLIQFELIFKLHYCKWHKKEHQMGNQKG